MPLKPTHSAVERLTEHPLARLRTSFSGRRSALALCVGFDGVSAAVYRSEKTGKGKNSRREENLSAVAYSRDDDFDAALADVLRQLAAAESDPLPVRALLAAQTALPGVIELPVNPARPRKEKEMRALVLAEMEAAQLHFNGLWTIGALLLARGALTAEQCDEIALELEMRRAEGGSGGRSALFGELAIQMAYIGRPALDAALRVQEKLRSLESALAGQSEQNAALACTWQPALDRAPVGPGIYRWLACVAPRENLEVWRRACSRHGLALESVYPLAWCALAAGDAGKGADNNGAAESAALQLHDEEWAAILHADGNPAAARNEPRMDRPVEAGRLAALLDGWLPQDFGNHAGIVELQAWNPAWDTQLPHLAERIGELLGRPPLVSVPHAAVRERVLRALCRQDKNGGAARNAARGGIPGRLPHLPGRAPIEFSASALLPLARYLAPVAVLLVLAGVEAGERLRLEAIKKTYTENEQKAKATATLASNERRQQTELVGRRKELDRDSVEYTALVNENQRFANVADMRHNLPDLIRALSRTAGGDALIDRVGNDVARSDATHIQVIAWSQDYALAQSFVTRVQSEVARLGYNIALSEITAAKGRHEEDGYRVSFWLVPADDLSGNDPGGEADAEADAKTDTKANEKTGAAPHSAATGEKI